jgi:hypothetical protein
MSPHENELDAWLYTAFAAVLWGMLMLMLFVAGLVFFSGHWLVEVFSKKPLDEGPGNQVI